MEVHNLQLAYALPILRRKDRRHKPTALEASLNEGHEIELTRTHS